MNKAFQVLKDRPQIFVILTRESVCAADDCDALLDKTIKIHSFIDPVALAREASLGCLPSVTGGEHPWIFVLNNIKIEKIKTTGIQPLVHEATFEENKRIHFVYKSAIY